MEFDFERINANKFYSTSPTSLSSSSASSNSSLHAREAMMNQNKPMGRSNELASNKSATNQLTSSAAMSSSTSQIFLTAASFNICQNVIKFYLIHFWFLLAKFKISIFLGHCLLFKRNHTFAGQISVTEQRESDIPLVVCVCSRQSGVAVGLLRLGDTHRAGHHTLPRGLQPIQGGREH